MLKPLAWTTVTNTTEALGKKTATTHFGTVYTLRKAYLTGLWFADVTLPARGPFPAETETLADNVTFVEARKACIDDYTKSGGR